MRIESGKRKNYDKGEWYNENIRIEERLCRKSNLKADKSNVMYEEGRKDQFGR